MSVREPMPREEVAVLDANAEALGVEVRQLMANAGRAVAEETRDRAPGGPILVLCGKGNNGGDGLVAARHLAGDREVTVLLAARDLASTLAEEALDALPEQVAVHAAAELDDDELAELLDGAAVLLDGLLGAGAAGEPRGEVARIVDAQRGVDAFRVSIDVPTGAGTPGAFVPDVTVAVGGPKQMPDADVGELVVREIQIPEEAYTHTGPGELKLFPLPERTQHKGQGGFVLVVGGGPYAGAPALSAMAAMRTGADLAIVLTPEGVADAVAGFSPNLVVRPLEGDNLDFSNPANRTTLNKWLGMVDAVVVGPGLGKMDPVRESVPVVVNRVLDLGLPLVLDADALWAISENPPSFDEGTVLTPHAGEFNVLTGRAVPPAEEVEGRAKLAREAAGDLGATILLKGPTDVVATSQRVKRNRTGAAPMSTGGTGDVLTGIVAAVQAKGANGFDAARVAAYVNGKAGEAATRQEHLGMLATDVVDAIPDVLKTHLPDAV